MTTTTRTKIRITNREASKYVTNLEEFKANNIFAEWVDGTDSSGQPIRDARYVVYSYGPHWPLFIYDVLTDRWYANKSKYGITTSKHYGQAHPDDFNWDDPTDRPIYLHVDDMIKVATGGVTALIGEPVV